MYTQHIKYAHNVHTQFTSLTFLVLVHFSWGTFPKEQNVQKHTTCAHVEKIFSRTSCFICDVQTKQCANTVGYRTILA